MKKAILCAAALMLGTMAFAQVSGAPSATLVPALSGAAVGANTGESIQNGDHNRVRVRQAGTSQSAYTNQDNGTGTGGNLAKIRQTGAVQPGISGELNLAEVLQLGTENQAQLRQEGDLNNATARQGQTLTASARNKAKIRQGVADQAEGNDAAIEQDGDDNWAQTQQTFDNSDAWTVQLGDDNKSMINQNAGPNGTVGHLAQNEQVGTGNESSIAQSGAGARNTARAFQDGDNNQAKQLQSTDAASGGTGNTAIIAQGNITTGFFFSPIWGDLQGLDAITAGSQSLGSVGGIAFQTQSGSANDADIRQFGVDSPAGNYAEQNQSGSGNGAFIVQNLYGNPAGAANYARQDQDGTNSEAGISQRGFSHKAYQRQSDDDNIALSTQFGNRNLVNTYQDGDGNRGHTAQRGHDNTALLVQRGGHSYSIQQNLPPGGSGGNNQTDILQLGPDGDFATDGIDCVFEDQMDPTMDYTIPDFELVDVCPGC